MTSTHADVSDTTRVGELETGKSSFFSPRDPSTPLDRRGGSNLIEGPMPVSVIGLRKTGSDVSVAEPLALPVAAMQSTTRFEAIGTQWEIVRKEITARLSYEGADAATSVANLRAVMNAENDTAAVEAVFRNMYRAMLAADTAALGAMLGEGFTLTHISGFVQPRRDWLADIEARRMAYHAAQEVSLSTGRSSETATLVGRHVVDATIYGGRARWNLQLAADFARREGRWVLTRMVATTFR